MLAFLARAEKPQRFRKSSPSEQLLHIVCASYWQKSRGSLWTQNHQVHRAFSFVFNLRSFRPRPSIQCPRGRELRPGPSVDPVIGGSALSEASDTRTITIIFGTIGAALTLVTVVMAFLQYRLQRRRTLPDAKRDSDSIQ
jgi:hypothetical protein